MKSEEIENEKPIFSRNKELEFQENIIINQIVLNFMLKKNRLLNIELLT